MELQRGGKNLIAILCYVRENGFNSRKFSLGDNLNSSGKVENETALLTL